MESAEFTRTYLELSPRRQEVLRLFLQGKKDAEIAEQLHITPATVRQHLKHICQAFALSNLENKGSSHRSELIALIAKHEPSWLTPEQVLTKTTNTKILLSYHGGTRADKSLASELENFLKERGDQVFIVSSSLRMATNGLQQIYAELNCCDRLLLLLSPLAARSEMFTEEVRLAKILRDTRADHRPEILAIGVNCPFSLLNHDLRGYLQGIPDQEWHSPEDTPAIINAIANWLASGETQITIPVVKPSFPTLTYSVTPNYPPQPVAEPELPRGQVELASAFYVERTGIDQRCYEAITKPGTLIRIKAPRQMGKTSLMARILHRATQQGYATVPLSFQLADNKIFADLEQFLKWFCAVISFELELPDRLTDYWQGIFGSKVSCKSYFERYLLTNISTPLVLGLDEVDRVFQYPELAADFFGLLRAWHEESKNREIWRKLGLVVVHSTEAYIPMDINQSPFNVGLPIELPEFKPEQVQDLAHRHGLAWDTTEVDQLMGMVGGHPYLIRVSLYHIARQEITLTQLLNTAATDAGLYSDHLRRHLWNLSQHPELASALKKVIAQDSPVPLHSMAVFKLHSMGLVNLQGNDVTPRCNLYRQYFRVRLASVG